MGGGPRVVVSTAACHAGVRGSVPGLGGLKGTKMFLPHSRVKLSIVESLCDREVACNDLYWTDLHWDVLHYIELHCFALHCRHWKYYRVSHSQLARGGQGGFRHHLSVHT